MKVGGVNMDIIDFIPYGKKNAISNGELAILLNTDKRTARKIVHQARVKGANICSSCEGGPTAGYYIPLSDEEAKPYQKMQRSRIESALAALKPTEDFINNFSK